MYWYGAYGVMPSDKTKKQLARRENNIEFQNVFNKLLNLDLDTFGWDKLPETCDERMIETALIWRSYAVGIKDKGEIWVYSAGPGGKITKYGYPSTGFWYALNGETGQTKLYWKFMDNTGADGALIMDNRQCYPHINYIIRGAERISDARRALDVAAQNAKFPYILQCTEEQKNTILSIFNDAYNNDPLIITSKDNDFTNNTEIFNTGVREGLIKELWDYYTNTHNEVLNDIGIQMNQNSDKKERMTIQEVKGSSQYVERILNHRLQAREESAERFNTLFGTNIKPYIKTSPSEYAEELEKIEEQNNETEQVQPNNNQVQ